MPGPIQRMAPLVEQLQRLCHGHERGDGGQAAAGMRAYVREVWTDVPEISLSEDKGDEHTAEELVLTVIGDVGRLATVLLSARGDEAELAWSRANLIRDLERYEIAVESAA